MINFDGNEGRNARCDTVDLLSRTQSIYPQAPAGRDQSYDEDCVVSGFVEAVQWLLR